jgi:predicted transcriptional regulator
MAVKNRLKDVLTRQLGEEITAYRFKKLTGLGQATSLNALHNPDWYPDKKTAETSCRTFNLQLADFLFYVDDSQTE